MGKRLNGKTGLILFLIVFCFTGFSYSQDFKELAEKHYQLGDFYYKQGRYKEAEDEFNKAVELLSEAEKQAAVVDAGKKVYQGGQGGYKEAYQPQVYDDSEKDIQKSLDVITKEINRMTERIETDKVIKKEAVRLEYIIGEADELQVLVWQQPDLNQDVIVRPDGRISLALIGDIEVAGKTITQLDEFITERYKEYIRFPEVSISIKKLGGSKVIVLGEVGSPGVYSVTGTRTILEAIGLAGGFSTHAVASSVVLIRGGFGNPEAKRINLSKAIKRGDARENVALEPEDVVFVPKKFIANLNYFMEQMLGPISRGSYTSGDLERY